MTALVAGVVCALFYWLKEKFIRPRVPRWADAVLFCVLFGLAAACGDWIGVAIGWRTSGSPVPSIVGGTVAGALIGFGVWHSDRRAPGKGVNP